jgi:nucleotide-binding universal stress UspA family protein
MARLAVTISHAIFHVLLFVAGALHWRGKYVILGHSGPRHLTGGSTAASVSRRATCSALVVQLAKA